MKRFILAIALLTQVLAAGSALAVAVDFSDITEGQNLVIPDSVYLGGITISYDDYGTGTELASAETYGIFATTAGTLLFDFAIPATTLDMAFSLLYAVSDTPQVADALTVLFYGGGEFIDFATASADFFAFDPLNDPTLGNASGIFSYSGSPFDHAELYFSMAAPMFTVDSISYQPVPEPGTILLLAAGMIGACAWCMFRKKICREPIR